MRLYVLYDASCGLCSHLVQWMSEQSTYCQVQFVAAGSDQARRLFPQFVSPPRPEELVVIGDDGGVYRGEGAYLILLYAMDAYRPLAVRLSGSAFRPMARKIFGMLSTNRLRLSELLGLQSDDALARAVADRGPEAKVQPSW